MRIIYNRPGPSRKARRLAWLYSRGAPWQDIVACTLHTACKPSCKIRNIIHDVHGLRATLHHGIYIHIYIYIQYPVLLYIGNIVYMNHFRIQGFLYIRDIPGKLHWDHWLCSGGCVWYGWACWRWPKQEVCCAVSSFTGASQQIRHLP